MMRLGLVCAAAVAVAVAVLASVPAARAAGSDVWELDPAAFKTMLKSDEVVFVEFYAPWCGHCQRLAPEYAKAATALKGLAKMAAVDMTKHQELGGPYNVQGFPTIKVFGANKKSPSDYQGPRTAQGLVDAAVKEVQKVASARLSGRAGSNSGNSGSGSSGGGNRSGGSVIELTDATFKSQVLGSSDVWLVAFIAPWCGHCQRLKPEWSKAASELGGEVKLGQVDATVYEGLAGQYGVRGYPTIKVFINGQVEDYEAGRDASSIVAFARQKLEENAPPPQVTELVSEDAYKEACGSKSICMVSFLPDLLDTGAAGRNTLIEQLQKLADANKRKPFGWVWTVAGAQPELEKALNVGGAGFPALSAINGKKLKYATHRRAFESKPIQEFVNSLVAGREATAPLSNEKLPTIAKVNAWDGQDAELSYEEEIDLSELDDVEVELKKEEL